MAESGGGGPDDESWKLLSTEDQIVHKAWKARVAGFEAAKQVFDMNADMPKSPEFQKYLGLIKNFVSDGNQIALDKGLDAALSFVQYAQCASKTFGDVGQHISSKCLGGSKAKLKEKGQQILLMYVEIEQQNAVIEEMVANMEAKNPKVVAASVETLRMGLKEFGHTVMNPKLYLNSLIAKGVLTHKDKAVRDEAKLLTIELRRWIGQQVVEKNILEKLGFAKDSEPAWVKELMEELSKAGEGPAPTPTRFTRTEQARREAAAGSAASGGATSEGGADAEAVDEGQAMEKAEPDPWEFQEAVDITTKIPSNFQENLTSPKWQERKAALEGVLTLLKSHSKLDPGANYGELMESLKNTLANDKNINVQADAAKCIGAVATGLRRKFAPFNAMTVPVVFEKLKEKKQLLAGPLRDCIDAIAKTAPLDTMLSEIIAALKDKNPIEKKETALFLSRLFKECTAAHMPAKTMKPLVEVLLEALNDQDKDVREATMEVFGAIMKVAGEPALLRLLPKLDPKQAGAKAQSAELIDPIKMAKIKEYAENVEVVKISSIPLPAGAEKSAPSASAAKPAPSGNSAAKPPANKQPKAEAGESKAAVAKTVAKPTGARAPSASRAKSATRKPEPVKKVPSAAPAADAGLDLATDGGGAGADEGLVENSQSSKAQRFADEKAMKILKWNFTQVKPEFVDMLKDQLAGCTKPSMHGQMFSINFKEHTKAAETLIKCISTCPDVVVNNLDLLLKWCTLRFGETNPVVVEKCMEFVVGAFDLCIARDCRLHDYEVSSFVPFLLTKAGDNRSTTRDRVPQIITRIQQIYGASKLLPYLIDSAKVKNSRQRAESLKMISQMIETFGAAVCPVVSQREIARLIGDKDGTVRTAAMDALVMAYPQLNVNARDEFEKLATSLQLSDKDASMLKERFKRTVQRGPLIKRPDLPDDTRVARGSGSGSVPGTPVSAPIPSTGSATITRPTSRKALHLQQNGLPEAPPGIDTPEDEEPALPKKKGMFELDWEKIGPNPITNDDFTWKPSLKTDWKAVDELLAEPVVMYEPKNPLYRQRYPKINIHAAGTSIPSGTIPSASSSIASSMEASVSLDSVITQIAAHNPQSAIAALSQLDELLKDPARVDVLTGRVDQLLHSIFFQFRLTHNTHMNDDSRVEKVDVVALYRNLCMVLLSLLNNAQLIQESSAGSLRDLVNNLITVLLDHRLEAIPDGDHVIRSINVMVVKLVERSNPTHCLVALIRLLKDCVSSQATPAKFEELVLKCLWKMSRMLPEVAEKLYLETIFLEIHYFLVAFPQASWKLRQSDTPLRTIKTIMHTLTKILGPEVLQHIGSIDDPQESEAVAYLRKVVKAVGNEYHKYGENAQNGVQKENAKPTGSSSSSLSSAHRSRLVEIFAKVGNKEQTKEGLTELYRFRQSHPDVDMGPFMERSSDYFRTYVERGLQQIEADEAAKKRTMTPRSGGTAQSTVPDELNLITDPEILVEKLKQHRLIDGSKVGDLKQKYRNFVEPARSALVSVLRCKALSRLDVSEYFEPAGKLHRSDSLVSADYRLDVKSVIMETPPVRMEGDKQAANPEELTALKERLANVKRRSLLTQPPHY